MYKKTKLEISRNSVIVTLPRLIDVWPCFLETLDMYSTSKTSLLVQILFSLASAIRQLLIPPQSYQELTLR